MESRLDPLRAKIREAVENSKTTSTALARAIKRDQGYIRDFLNGKKETIGGGELVDMERFLRLPPGSFTNLAAADAQRIGSLIKSTTPQDNDPPDQKTFVDRKLPVYGRRSQLISGGLLMDPVAVDYTNCPAVLDAVADAFACYVPDNTMAPRYMAGEVVYIHPSKPVAAGSFVLVQTVGTPPLGLVRRVVSLNAGDIEVEQFSPPKKERIKRENLVAIERIVASAEA